MLSFQQIYTVALYESKTLRRSWFFRIFLGLTLFIFFFLNFAFYTYSGDGVWMLRAIAASAPYINMLYVNIPQAVIAVFLSSDLLKKDNKMDTTEVIYTMPVSNSEYIIGKVLGNLFAFAFIDIFLLLIALVYNLIAPGMGFDPSAYIYYFLLIPIPSLIFITGLSFLLMTLLRNQAITFLVLLGLLGVSLFYLQGDHYYLFDQFGLYLPMIKSDITGFDNPLLSIGQRLMYFFTGAGLILLTVGLFKRLPKSGNRTVAPFILSTIFILIAGIIGFVYVDSLASGKTYREKLVEINNKYSTSQTLKPVSYKISIKQNNVIIDGACDLVVKNENSVPVSTTIFRLNPGLKINGIKINEAQANFSREEHLIIVNHQTPLNPGDSATLNFNYVGKINETAMYLDVDEERREIGASEFFRINPKTSFQTKDYTLLTPECEWYPQPGISFCTNGNTWYKKWFSQYYLEVKTEDSLVAISQGEVTKNKNSFTFINEKPLPAITLAIGNFVKKSFSNDSLTISVYMDPQHIYFEKAFEKLKPDTIETIFRGHLSDYSRKILLEYPYKRLTLIEVPLHYKAFQRPWSGALENTQPEILLVPEKGALVENADFKRTMNRIKRWGRFSGEGKLTDQEVEVKAIGRFVDSFTQTTINSNNEGDNQIENLKNPYNIFSMYYDAKFFLASAKYPIIDRCLQSFFINQGKVQTFNFFQDTRLSDSEKANKKLQELSFAEILSSKVDFALVDKVVNLKGEMLFSIVQSQAGELAFKNYLTDLINNNSYKSYDYESFQKNLMERFSVNIGPFVNDWFYSKQIPGYQIELIKTEKIKDVDRLKTQVVFRVTNTEMVEGIVQAKFILSDKNQENAANYTPETFTKTVLVKGGEKKEVVCLLHKEPRSVSFNTMVSKNIPSLVNISLSNIKESANTKLTEGERVIKEENLRPAEIIVDNEDSLFKVVQPTTSGVLPVLLDRFRDDNEEEYSWFRWWRAPINWKKTIGSTYYGKNILSVDYCRAGEGERVAVWSPEINATGLYEVYYHVYIPDEDYMKSNIVGEYRFSITHDDGSDNPILDLRNSETGWTHLGTYYFSSGSSPRIELSNNTTAKMVIADAIKLVKLND